MSHARANALSFFVVSSLDSADNTLPQGLFVKRVIFIKPLCHRQIQPKLGLQLLFQPGYIPLLFDAHRRDEAVHSIVHHVLADRSDRLTDLIIRQQFVSLTINNLSLVIGHVIVFEQLLTDIKVASFDFPLRFFDGIAHHAMLNGLTPFHTQGLHEALDPVGGENTHQVVFE